MVQADSLKRVVVVCGPTGSGKSDLALKLAKYLDTDIISADSIAVFKGLNVGSAKPSEDDRAVVKHHLIDVLEPSEDFSVAEYKRLSRSIADELIKNGKTPVVCGGTGYFIDALLFDRSYGNCPKDPVLREKLKRLYDENGADYLYSLLKKVDPESCSKLSKNDFLRVSRALEIFYTTGVKKSDIVDDSAPVYDYIAFYIDHDRESLYKRINERVDKMFENGLIEEVRTLLAGGMNSSCQSMQGIGYKEIVEGLSLGRSEEEMKEIIKRNTRRYAKRQITYFKRMNNLYALQPESAFENAMEMVKKWME